MHFLKFNDQEEPSLVDYYGSNVPLYGILSYTWGSEEVTYEELKQGTGTNKTGYEKIRFCAKRSDLDGLRYFWIDTCCINRANFTELSEAINSVFKWYRKAARCYVYLSDVPDPNDPSSTIESAFLSSRWFKRGWTLQELIAPASVHFFSQTGELLGSKQSRIQQVYQITGIDIEALQGKCLSKFSIDKRIPWARGRETTIEEDAAYCLLGIFGIYMSLIYGKGQQSAMDRLRRKVQKSLRLALLGSNHTSWLTESALDRSNSLEAPPSGKALQTLEGHIGWIGEGGGGGLLARWQAAGVCIG